MSSSLRRRNGAGPVLHSCIEGEVRQQSALPIACTQAATPPCKRALPHVVTVATISDVCSTMQVSGTKQLLVWVASEPCLVLLHVGGQAGGAEAALGSGADTKLRQRRRHRRLLCLCCAGLYGAVEGAVSVLHTHRAYLT